MNSNIASLRRLNGEFKNVVKDPMEFFDVYPDENNIFIWYFLLRGPNDSHYEGGLYIGKIIHDVGYPFKPPSFMMLTPNGRFIHNDKICMSNSNYHKDEWSPLWGVKAILNGFLSIMMDDREHGIAHIKDSVSKRLQYAKESIEYNKRHHPDIIKYFTRFLDGNGNAISSELVEKKDKLTREKYGTNNISNTNNITFGSLIKNQMERMEKSKNYIEKIIRKFNSIK